MNANDLITQVHSEEDENGHIDHDQHGDGEVAQLTFWQKFLGCLLCKNKPPPSHSNISKANNSHAYGSNNNKANTGLQQNTQLSTINQHTNNSNNVQNNTSINNNNSLSNKSLATQQQLPAVPSSSISSLP